MKIIIIGLPYFSKKIARELSSIDTGNTYISLDPSNGGFRQKILFIWHLLSAEVLYSISGNAQCGKSLKLALILHKKIIMHWVGTDILNAHKIHKAGQIDNNLIKKTKHLTETEWLQTELHEIGIKAKIVALGGYSECMSPLPVLPKTFSIFSYIGKGREKFYGIDKIISLANTFPHIPIRIAGISEYHESLPANIKLLGWIKDMNKEYIDCVVFLRLPEHDGLAHSVREALIIGRYVGYTYAFNHTSKITDMNDLVNFIENLQEHYNKGLLDINLAGSNFIHREFSLEKVSNTLINELINIQER